VSACELDRERPDRAGLVDHQRRLTVLGRPLEERFECGLVVAHAALEEPLARRSERGRVVVLLADVEPDPDVDPLDPRLVHPLLLASK
jgi:hypothetical protein